MSPILSPSPRKLAGSGGTPPESVRVLLVDPSPRGGLPVYTRLVARSLIAAGAVPAILGSAALETAESPVSLLGRLPSGRWGKPDRAGPGFYLGRLKLWALSAAIVLRHVRRTRPDVVHFQFSINRRFDAWLVRGVKRIAPVVWTAHDVLPFERVPADSRWYASIYRTADRVIVHTEPAAEEVEALSGVRPAVIAHPVSDEVVRVPQEEARRRLGLEVEGRMLAALGFIRPYKGYELLADVWERLGEDAPQLLVMGELLVESERPVVERLRRTGRADVRVGYASDVDLQLALIAGDALLLPYGAASDSGLVHLARALRVPVLASDAPQLAATVRASGAGRVVPRTVDAWSAAITGPLPPPPPAPPDLLETGRSHLAVYSEVLGRRR